jgi:predicted acetyltransferase
VSWERGQGYGDVAKLKVSDLLATGPAAYRALLAAMGSFSSVTPQTRIDTSGFDIIRLFINTLHWHVVDSSPYMLKVLDVSGALTQRRYPAGFSGELAFSVTGDFLPHNNGSYLLDVGNGRGNCVRGEHSGRLLTPHGLSLMFAGAQSSANLRAAGQLSGGSVDEDSTWDALFGGRQVHIRDYF